MTAVNQFLPFGTGGGAGVVSQADYLAASPGWRSEGFVNGMADPLKLNKVWRQSSAMSAMLGQFISDALGVDVLDDGDLVTLQANFELAIAAFGGATPTFAPAGTGAVTRTMKQELDNIVVNVLRFIDPSNWANIKNGTSVFDCRPGLQATIDYCASVGCRRMFVPWGIYPFSDDGSTFRGLHVTAPLIIEGEGVGSCLKPMAGTPATSHNIHFQPNPGLACDQTQIRNLAIMNPSNGLREGASAIFLDTQVTNASLPKPCFDNISLGQSVNNVASFYTLNDPAHNINGGVFGLCVRNSQLRGGIYLNGPGDSLAFENLLITDIGGYATTGLYVSTVTGASHVKISDCNITTVTGAIQVDQGRRVMVTGLNAEQVVPGGSFSSMVNFNGGVGVVAHSWIVHSNLFAGTGTGIAYCVRLNNTNGVLVDEIVTLPASAGTWAVSPFAGAANTVIGRLQLGTGSTLKVQDNGSVNLIGVWRDFASFSNGWANFNSGFATAQYIKTRTGQVIVKGEIAGGTIPAPGSATPAVNLPADYRPGLSQVFSAASQSTGPAAVLGQFVVAAASGNIAIAYGDNSKFDISCSFMAANLADYVSNL